MSLVTTPVRGFAHSHARHCAFRRRPRRARTTGRPLTPAPASPLLLLSPANARAAATGGYYRKAKSTAEGLAALFPGRFRAEVHEHPSREAFREWLMSNRASYGEDAEAHRSSPFCWRNEKDFIGGCDDTLEYCRDLVGSLAGPARPAANGAAPGLGRANTMVDDGFYGTGVSSHGFDYDLVVIGGGSGGLAMGKKAAKLGAQVCMLDFVKPSPAGSTWGLGGTCVNVGCIPKKLMHTAALLREATSDATDYGWRPSVPASADWETLRTNVQNHIKSLNFGYRSQLSKIKQDFEGKVDYKNALGRFVDAHTIECTNKRGKVTTVTAARFLIAVGGRPRALACEGGELAISSDDLFSLPSAPGKTLVVGGGYVALECAGFLAGLGFEVTLLVRSILLRGFDRECVDRIQRSLEEKGVTILFGKTPEKLERTADEKITCHVSGGASEPLEGFDTVLCAIGRAPDLAALNVEALEGVQVKGNGKISAEQEQTGLPHVYAIGDCTFDSYLELTPVAIQSGELLAERLYSCEGLGGGKAMDFTNVATTVFAPVEYGSVGYTEEEAKELLGDCGLEVYHKEFMPLEHTVVEARQEHQMCFCKVLVDKNSDRVVGMHYFGPNAGEVIQGYAAAVKAGLTFTGLKDTVGIHPTSSEEFTTISITKSSGESATASGC